MNKEHIPPEILPSLDTMPELSDESIADVLTWLVAFVDAFEEHYADPLSRWRQRRYEELMSSTTTSNLICQLTPQSITFFELTSARAAQHYATDTHWLLDNHERTTDSKDVVARKIDLQKA